METGMLGEQIQTSESHMQRYIWMEKLNTTIVGKSLCVQSFSIYARTTTLNAEVLNAKQKNYD